MKTQTIIKLISKLLEKHFDRFLMSHEKTKVGVPTNWNVCFQKIPKLSTTFRAEQNLTETRVSSSYEYMRFITF